MKIDIHYSQQKLENIVESIRYSQELSDDNKLTILKFIAQCRAESLRPATILKHVIALRHTSKFLNKSLEQADRDDIAQVCRRFEEKDWSDATKRNARVTLKKFYKWVRQTEYYPDEVRWIKTSQKSTEHQIPNVLTEEEVLNLVRATENPRDKALVFTLYESGCRIGEVLSLRIGDVQLTENGTSITVSGKTGSRRILLISSSNHLLNWLESHPMKEDQNAPLWVTKFNRHDHNSYGPLGYAGVNKLLDTLAAKIKLKKRIYPHLFRHSRATHLANKLTEAQMKQLFGWKQGSNMAAVYVHLSGRDVDHALLELHGLSSPSQNETKLRVKSCPRCQERNTPDAVYCKKCTFPLDAEAMDAENKIMNELTQNPRASKYLRRMVREIIVKSR